MSEANSPQLDFSLHERIVFYKELCHWRGHEFLEFLDQLSPRLPRYDVSGQRMEIPHKEYAAAMDIYFMGYSQNLGFKHPTEHVPDEIRKRLADLFSVGEELKQRTGMELRHGKKSFSINHYIVEVDYWEWFIADGTIDKMRFRDSSAVPFTVIAGPHLAETSMLTVTSVREQS